MAPRSPPCSAEVQEQAAETRQTCTRVHLELLADKTQGEMARGLPSYCWKDTDISFALGWREHTGTEERLASRSANVLPL